MNLALYNTGLIVMNVSHICDIARDSVIGQWYGFSSNMNLMQKNICKSMYVNMELNRIFMYVQK